MRVDRIIMLSGSAKTAMSVALLAIAAVAMYGWIVSPHVGYLYAVQRYEPVVAEAAKEKKVLSMGLAAKRRRLEETRARLAVARAALFTPAEAQDFFGGMEGLCRKTGCTFTSIDFLDLQRRPRAAAPSKAALVQTRRAGLALSGSYDEIVALLHDLQSRSQRVVIDSCRIELPNPAEAHSGRLQCDISMTIWVISTGGADNA